MKRFTLSKHEKLKSRTDIELLFAEGNSFKAYPIILIYRMIECDASEFPVKVSFSVSKKHHKLAVSRNRIKRLMRESYRMNKHAIADKITGNHCLHLMFIYLKPDMPSHIFINTKVIDVLKKLNASLES